MHCLDKAVIKFLDAYGSINYCLCAVLASITVLYSSLVNALVYMLLVKKVRSP